MILTKVTRLQARIAGAALAVMVAALLAACSDSADAKAPDIPPAKGVTEVIVKGMRFTPQVIEVPAGTTVTWRFEDGPIPHDVKGDGFASKAQSSGTFTYVFATPGTYEYRCTLHPNMAGRVIVTG